VPPIFTPTLKHSHLPLNKDYRIKTYTIQANIPGTVSREPLVPHSFEASVPHNILFFTIQTALHASLASTTKRQLAYR
jgi:hypothetical protein